MRRLTAEEARDRLDAGVNHAHCRHLLVVFGDQLTRDAPAFREFDSDRDVVLMAEVRAEAEHVPSHRQRTALFFSAMRHFALDLLDRRISVRYIRIDGIGYENGMDRSAAAASVGPFAQSLDGEVRRAVAALNPEAIHLTRPGEHRVMAMVDEWKARFEIPVRVFEEAHFLTDPSGFSEWAGGRKQMLMEHFYRWQRKRLDLLMENGKPVGGKWNFDAENRAAFKKRPDVPPPYAARPDAITQDVMDVVNRLFPDAYGRLDRFRWPVTRAEGLRALTDFIEHRLPDFGTYEDAMWAGEPFLYHSLLSAPLNLKLLDPRECVQAALDAGADGRAPLNAVEGFVRQIIGWREFIRGVYWHEGADYGTRNFLDQHGALPDFYWTGETDMRCMAECLAPVIADGYAHHIPRLMVMGNFALISGIHPRAITDWFLAMYVDAVDWVTTPNTLGMSQHADGVRAGNGGVETAPVVGTKPYAASGKYIQRMSNFCKDCPYDVKRRDGDRPCPFNVFYWDFLIRHQDRFAANHRMALILKNVERMEAGEKIGIRNRGNGARKRFGIGETP
jgi:deoxyribodipyrimidine photolyase-related protein